MINRSMGVLLPLMFASGLAGAHPGHAAQLTTPGTALHLVLQHVLPLGLTAAGIALVLLSIRHAKPRDRRRRRAAARRGRGTK